MEWLEQIPARARLALSVGGAILAAEAGLLPASLQLAALSGGIILCAFGISVSMRPLYKSRDPDWLDDERCRDFERQQEALTRKFRKVKPTA
jgi:hypothetical protein